MAQYEIRGEGPAGLLAPASEDLLELRPVPLLVNNVKNDGPALLGS